MITYDIFRKSIKNNSMGNSYIFCGGDEELIKDGVNQITKPYIDGGVEGLNFIKIDGARANIDEILNACETIPFMSDKKVVLISRANFIKDKSDSVGTKLFNELKEYLKDVPSYTIFIMYFVFEDKRDTPKKNKKLMSIDKITTIVHVDKLKKDGFIKKVSEIFIKENKEIGNVELRYFCDKVQNNFEIIKNEIDKLISYTEGREIKRVDIDKLLPRKSEDDIFDLVDFVSQRKIEKAIDIMDEMLFKADQHMLIVISLENQFKKLYRVKLELMQGKSKDDIASILRVPSFISDKLINLSKKFSKKQLEKLLELTIKTEGRLKSINLDKRTELELLLINTLLIEK